MSKRATDREARRSVVMRAALEAAKDAGAAPIRVQDIAARAQMSAGHVMYYFGSRDRVVAETLLFAEAELAVRRDRALARAADAPAAVVEVVRLYLPARREDARWKLWSQLVASPPRDRTTLVAYAQAVDSWSVALELVVAAGVTAHQFSCADPAAFAYRACRLMDGYALEVLLGSPGRTRAWAVREVTTALFVDLHHQGPPRS